MKKIICLTAAVILAVSAAGCGNTGDTSEASSASSQTQIEVAAGYERYDVGEALDTVTAGFGAQIDTDVYMPWNNLTADEEAMLEKRIADMNLQFTRIKFFPEFFERANDNDDPDVFDADAEGIDFDSTEMRALYKILDICEKYGINVDLSWYGCYAWFDSYDGKYDGSWLGYSDEVTMQKNWVTAPRKTAEFDGFAEYAENIYVGLDYLINVKKYTCLYGFSVIAEMFMDDKGVISWDAYAECVKGIDERLEKEGLRDKIKFLGTSNSGNNTKYFKDEQAKTKDYFDILGTGNYNWDNDDYNESMETYFADIIGIARDYGKQGWYVAEFCQGKHFINAVDKEDIDWYEAGLYISRFVIAAASQGATMLNHYILGDTWFTNSYVHTMGLWAYRDKGWKAHPEYYFYGLICKYTDIGSKVYPIKSTDDVSMIAFQLPDGSWSYMMANCAGAAKKVAVVNAASDGPKKLDAYKVTEALIPSDRAVELPTAYDNVDVSGGVTYVTLPANGFVVLSDKK